MNQEDLERLKEFERFTLNGIAKGAVKTAACERYFERLIGRAIDINQHIIAVMGTVLVGVLRYRAIQRLC